MGVINMKIDEILKVHNTKKVIIETTEARIEQYKWCIEHPEEWYRDFIPERELGMPKGSGFSADPISGYINDKELNEEVLKDWIKREESKIIFIRLEVKQLELSLKVLNEKELFIVENKYINDKMSWDEIETSYPYTFKEQLTIDTLKKKSKKALGKIKIVLTPFYNEYGIEIK